MTSGFEDELAEERFLITVAFALSRLLDTISEAYQSKGARDEFRRILVANVYVGLISLLKACRQHWGKDGQTADVRNDFGIWGWVGRREVLDHSSFILASVLPACGQELMAGSDFLDTISEAYQSKGARDEFADEIRE
jgi:hypothetical protein